jgi:uncharacterized protein
VPLPAGLPNPAVSRHVFYLHGFASGAKSTKGGYFADRLRERGVDLTSPDFNEPDFTTLTFTRMLNQLGAELARAGPEPVALIGSSLGGTLAVLAAERFANTIDRIVLLAPAVMFAKPGHHLLPPDRIEEWRRRGTLPFFHYAYNAERPLGFAFYEDSLVHDAFTAVFTQPAIVFQGLRDASVDHRTVEAFARTRPNVKLSLLDDDHQLIASLPRIWEGVAEFLGLAV